VIFVITAALSALSVGASVLVAQAVGAGSRPEAGRVARQAIIWSVLIALPLTAIGLPLTPAIIGLFGLEPGVAQVSVGYLGVTMGTIATLTMMLLIGGVLRGAGDSRTPMLVTALANVINVAVSYALIYGHLGMPALGAVGSAWGAFASRLVGAIILVAVVLRGRNDVRAGGGGSWLPSIRVFGDILKVGVPAALEEVLVIFAFATLTPIVATLGTVSLAAQRVVINILSLSFLPGLGFGLAATALVGQAIGARRPDEARAVIQISLRWAVMWMGGLGLLFFIFAEGLVRIFSPDPNMIATGAAAIRVVAFTQPFWAATFVYAGALRGTGDTRTPLIITGAAIWSAVGIGVVLMNLSFHSLAGIWAAFLFVGPIETTVFWWAWRRTLVSSPLPQAEEGAGR
jgi:putative MATE family efflux protein